MTTAVLTPTSRAAGSLSAGVVRAHGTVIFAAAVAYVVLVSLPWPDGASRFILGEFAGVAFAIGALILMALIWRSKALPATPAWSTVGALAIAFQAATTALLVSSIVVNVAALQTAGGLALWASNVVFVALSAGVIAGGVWTGPLRYLPLVLASWPHVVVATLVVSRSENDLWLALTLSTAIGLAINGLATLVLPRTAGIR